MKIVEDFNHFICIIDVYEESDVGSSCQTFEDISIVFQEEKLEYALMNDGETVSGVLDSLAILRHELVSQLKEKHKTDNFSIKLSCYKDTNNRLPIYSQVEFLKNVPSDFKSALGKWNQHIGKNLQIKTLNESKEIVPYDLAPDISRYSLPNVMKNSLLLPEAFNSLTNRTDSLSNYFQIFTAQFCLHALASNISDETGSRRSYSFEGYARVTLETNNDEEYIDRQEMIFEVYRWVFIDNNYSTRLGILRNVMSIKNSESFVELFDNDLLRILQSNYKIYLKDNIKQYIEVKNKTSEFMFELHKKADDIVEDYKSTLQKLILGILTYFFTVAMVKIFNKADTVILTKEVTVITSILLVLSIVFLYFTAKDLERRKKQLTKQLINIKRQYLNVIDKQELDSVFNDNLITNIDDDISTVFKSWFWIVILVALLIATLIIAATNSV
jgi:hypothetical protein